MGYEVMALIGRLEEPEPEYERDLNHPFDDGSGYPYLTDENGDRVPTGRFQQYFSIYAQMDLSKIGYGSTLTRTIKEHRKKTEERNAFPYCYTDGNRELKGDPYGSHLVPVPFDEALEAVRKDMETDDYRRLRWFAGLLEAMEQYKDELTCVFYGH